MVELHMAQITRVNLRIAGPHLGGAEGVVVHQLEVLVPVNEEKQNPGLLLWMINSSMLVINFIEIHSVHVLYCISRSTCLV